MSNSSGGKDSTENPVSTGTVSRALRLLSILADADKPVTIKYASEKMQLAPSTVHRLLGLLKEEGFAVDVIDTRCYAVGPQFYRVSARVIENSSQMEFIRRVLQDTVATYDETVLFGQYLPSEGKLSFALRCDGHQKLLYQIEMHRPLSLVWGSSGKAVLAHLPPHRVADILSREGNSPGDSSPPPDYDDLMQQLSVMQTKGYCISHGEKLPGSRGIAAAVFDRSGVIGSICLTSPETRMPDADLDEIGRDLARRAELLSHELGAKS
ncbi:IclR family transcriptional regulator [Granulosicoccus sp. 3-233]|uniref:IclR family transcriptional regulator n=1 Tax=Granulosicoccus sp. 3-233 TaxID=3417969 RepID=UPI003D34639C